MQLEIANLQHRIDELESAPLQDRIDEIVREKNRLYAHIEELENKLADGRWDYNEAVIQHSILAGALESLTPGGSEFHGSAGRCVEWVRARLVTTGKIAAERNELRARVEEMAELCRRAAREMNNLGNITNWPPETPMSYAEMINELRAAK